jgi:thiamine biosynthesis protein ThiI
VDLGSPEVTAHVELEPGTVHFFLDKVAGHGGLPLGVEGRAVALVSGGFDSAVAAWLLLKRGVQLEYVFVNLGGAAHRQGVLEVMRVIARRWSYGSRPRLHEVDLRPVVAEMQEKTSPRYWQILLKRLMLQSAETIARQGGAAGIVTGDAIGQVSSQTVQNLAVISQATRLPVLRPLLGFNKEEIFALARQIGVYDAAAVVAEYCGLQGRRPATRASLDSVIADEAKLEPGGWRMAVGARTVHDLRAPEPAGLALPAIDVEIDAIPPGATVLDLRAGTAFLAWHYPGALHLELPNALAAYASFDRDRTYVLVCEVGLKSAHLAERMQEAGFRAFHFKGGTKALLRLAEREGLLDPGLLAPAVR